MSGIGYTVDLVFCIDKTGSMGPVISDVKRNASEFHEHLLHTMERKQKAIDKLRIRVIAFGDCYVDGPNWFMESEFYTMPGDVDDYKAFVESIHADGGGDEPENGLEALSRAIESDWAQSGSKSRQVVVVYTDASTHTLERATEESPTHYLPEMPSSFDSLTDLWESNGSMNSAAKRLVLFAPDSYPWNDIETHWSEVVMFPSKAGDGLQEHEYDQILDMLSNSI